MLETDPSLFGKLYMIPTPLGENEPLEVLPMSVRSIIEKIDHYIVENEKTARKFLKKISPRKSQAALQLQRLNKFTEPGALESFLTPCLMGHPMGILSEAGCPGIADPGAEVVRIAHRKQIPVVPLVGPSSILLALMASGLNGQGFAFHGYLPIESSERKAFLKRLEKVSADQGHAQIFIETPYRNDSLLKDLLKALGKHTLLCIASNITLSTESIATKSVEEWKLSIPDLHKKPAIFIVQAT